MNAGSDTLPKRRRYSEGSLVTERRKLCSHSSTRRCPHCVWVYRFSANIDGKRTRPKVIVGTVEQLPTKGDAKRASEHLRMAANAESAGGPQVTMRGLIDRYVAEVLTPCLNVPLGGVQDEAARMSFGTAQRYRCVLRKWIAPRWKDYIVSDFEKPQIRTTAEEWFQSVWRSAKNPDGLAPKYVRYIASVMWQVFKFAVKWGYLVENPMDEKRIELPPGSTKRLKRANQYTPSEFFRLFPLLPKREQAAAAFDGWLGTRGSEGLGLKWCDFDFNEGTVTFRQGFYQGRITLLKTEASRDTMPVPSFVVKVLREWRSITAYNLDSDWVFASSFKKGRTPIYPNTLMRQIQLIARNAGLPHVTLYSFRHSLSAWAKECLSPEELKTMLRHESVASGEGYGKIETSQKREIQRRLVAHVTERAKADGSVSERDLYLTSEGKAGGSAGAKAIASKSVSENGLRTPDPAHLVTPENEPTYISSVQDLSKVNNFGQQGVTPENTPRQSNRDEVTLTDPRLEAGAATGIRKARTVNAGTAFLRATVEKMWGEDKKISEIARAINLVDTNNPRDPYHSCRNLLYQMHKGYRNRKGEIVKLPHRVPETTIRKSAEAGRKAMRLGL
jgi:integrase